MLRLQPHAPRLQHCVPRLQPHAPRLQPHVPRLQPCPTPLQVFSELEASLPSLGVAEYGVSYTTLEDVFLRINEHKLLRLAQAEQGLQP